MSAEKLERRTGAMLGLALAVPWLFIWQGLDFTDQGYLLTIYRCFLRDPEATGESGSFWLTSFVGAVWDAVFGRFGVVSIRGLWALCLSAGLFVAFRIVARGAGQRAAAAGVLAASVFLSDRRETWFSYNTSSSLLFVVTAACLTTAVVTRRRSMLLGAGALIGILPFARFPNLLALGLLVVPSLAALVDAPRRRSVLVDSALLLLGVALGVGGMLALIHALGHAPLFFAGVSALFAPAAEKSGYGASRLLHQFARDEAGAIAWGLGVCTAGWALAQLFARLKAVIAWPLIAVASAVGAVGLAGTDELWRLVVPGTTYWVLAAVTLGLGRPELEQRLLAFIALCIVVIAPLGSNNGIRNAHMGLWLALPLVIALMFRLDVRWLAKQGPRLAVLAVLVLCGEGLHRAATYTYRDSTRRALTEPVPHPQLRGQRTTAARAKVVSEVLSELERRVAPGDYLLAFEGTPLLHYLTRTRPYLNRPWLMGAESPEDIERIAKSAPGRTGCLPVAVRTLKTTRTPEWPSASRPLETGSPQRAVRKTIKELLRVHGYKRTWSNGFFEILEPRTTSRAGCR